MGKGCSGVGLNGRGLGKFATSRPSIPSVLPVSVSGSRGFHSGGELPSSGRSGVFAFLGLDQYTAIYGDSGNIRGQCMPENWQASRRFCSWAGSFVLPAHWSYFRLLKWSEWPCLTAGRSSHAAVTGEGDVFPLKVRSSVRGYSVVGISSRTLGRT